MKNIIFTGVSGSGRIELLEELAEVIRKRRKSVHIHDLGNKIFEAANALQIHITDQKILDIDHNLLLALRKIAVLSVVQDMINNPVDINFIGIHATFRWKGRLIDGINLRDLSNFNADSIINVVDDVTRILDTNKKNKKWEDSEIPDIKDTNDWMMEEQFLTDIIANFLDIPCYVIGRKHNIENLTDLILSEKPKIYLSYPITAIKDANPELLERIQNDYLQELEKRFIVFNPLVIEDLKNAGKISKLPSAALQGMKTRTVDRDYHFIDQSDFVIVVYLTEKVSSGVLSEIIYASTHGKNVYMIYPFKLSPFIEEYTTIIFNDFSNLLQYFDSDEFKNRLTKSKINFGLFKS